MSHDAEIIGDYITGGDYQDAERRLRQLSPVDAAKVMIELMCDSHSFVDKNEIGDFGNYLGIWR